MHAGEGGGFAVSAADEVIALGADLYPRHVAQHYLGAVGVGAQHDGGEFFRRGQLALHGERHGDALAGQGGRGAQVAGGDLHVLLGDGGGEFAHGQAVGDQLGRVHPHAHRLFGAELLHAAHAFDAAQFFGDIARQVAAERAFVEAAAIRAQADQHQEAGGGGFHDQAVLAHRRRRRGSMDLSLFCTSTWASSGLCPV